MDILKVVSGNEGGGVLNCEVQFISEMIDQEVTVDCVIVGGGKSKTKYQSICNNNITINVSFRNFSGSLWERSRSVIEGISKSITTAREIICKLDKTYDAIAVRRSPYLLMGGMLGRRTSTPVYWHIPNSSESIMGRIYYKCVCSVLPIKPIANSMYTRDSLGLSNVPVVYPGYSPKRVKTSVRYSNKRTQKPYVFGILSRISHEKAQDIIIKAISRLPRETKKNIQLIIAGEIKDKKYYKKIKRLSSNVDYTVNIIGYTDNIGEFLSYIGVLINSRRNPEPFGISVAEAQAAGVPVISYSVGGPSEIIDDSITGWLVNEPNVTSYKDKIAEAIAQKKDWRIMGSRAKKRVEKFSVPIQVGKYLDVLNKFSYKQVNQSGYLLNDR